MLRPPLPPPSISTFHRYIQVRAASPPMADLEQFGHRREIRSIASDIVMGAVALLQEEKGNKIADKFVSVGIKGGSAGGVVAGGRVSLRALLGEPPYGTV